MDYLRDLHTADRIAGVLPLVQDRLGCLSGLLESSMGLTAPQMALVEYLGVQGACTVVTLTRALRKAQSSISEMVDRLEERRFVMRKEARDRRKTLVSLAPAGRRWIQERRDLHRRALLQILESLDTPERESLLFHLGGLLSITDQLSLKSRVSRSLQ